MQVEAGMITGSCHCRKVRYTITAIEDMWHCYCQTCRKTHSAQRNTAARVNRENFEMVSGADNLSHYESIPGKYRHFCATCGAHIYAEYPHLPFVVLRAASLDSDPGVRVSRSVWLAHDLPWLDEDDSVPHYEEGPPPAG